MPPKPFTRWFPTLALSAVGATLGATFCLLSRQPDLKAHLPECIALLLGAGGLYLVGVFLAEEFQLGSLALLVILTGALAFRLLVLPLPPVFSSDVYRYQWEGRVQRGGINPYTVYPEAPALGQLQDPEHPLETGKKTPTLYPPLSESAFAWVRTIAGYKRLFTAADLACLGILLLLLAVLKQPLHRVVVYAWNPGVVVAFAMDGHHDSLAILTLLVANLVIIARKLFLSMAFLALSFLSKFFSLLVFPVFLRRMKWEYAAVFLAVVALGYAPYLGAGRSLFTGLSDYAAGWEGNDSLFRLIRLAQTSKAQAYLVVAVLMLGLLAYTLKTRMEPLRASLILISGLLFLSPNAFPWYFTWMVPFLCFNRSVPLLLLSATCVLGYAPVVAYVAGQPYKDAPLILVLEYVPACLWLAYEGWRAGRQDWGLGVGGQGSGTEGWEEPT